MENKSSILKKGLFYGYVIVALGFFINLVLGGAQYTFSVFFEPLSQDFGWTRAATSGAFSLYMILHGTLYIFTGRLNDKLGPRIVMSLCGLIIGAGYALMSLTSQIWHIYLIYGVIIAIGMSGGYVPLVSTVTRWFLGRRKRGLMVGIAVAGIGMGTMVFPPLTTWLISNYGWQTSYVIIGIIAFVIIMSSAQFLRRAPEHVIQSGSDGSSIDSQQQGLTLQQSLKTRQFWLLSVAYFGFGLLLQAIMVHLVMHARGLGISAGNASSLFMVIGGSSVIARITMGNAADRIGNRSIIIGSFLLMGSAVAWLFFAKEIWSLYLFSIAFGIGYGGLVSTQSPIIADLFGIKSHGIILGVIVSVVTLGSAAGPVIAGAVYDASGSYHAAFGICVGFAVLGILLILFLKPLDTGGSK